MAQRPQTPGRVSRRLGCAGDVVRLLARTFPECALNVNTVARFISCRADGAAWNFVADSRVSNFELSISGNVWPHLTD